MLYFGAWRFADVLASCRELPELIVIICGGTALVIAAGADSLKRSLAFATSHRIVLVKVD